LNTCWKLHLMRYEIFNLTSMRTKTRRQCRDCALSLYRYFGRNHHTCACSRLATCSRNRPQLCLF
jgi:hypothetical protein